MYRMYIKRCPAPAAVPVWQDFVLRDFRSWEKLCQKHLFPVRLDERPSHVVMHFHLSMSCCNCIIFMCFLATVILFNPLLLMIGFWHMNRFWNEALRWWERWRMTDSCRWWWLWAKVEGAVAWSLSPRAAFTFSPFPKRKKNASSILSGPLWSFPSPPVKFMENG